MISGIRCTAIDNFSQEIYCMNASALPSHHLDRQQRPLWAPDVNRRHRHVPTWGNEKKYRNHTYGNDLPDGFLIDKRQISTGWEIEELIRTIVIADIADSGRTSPATSGTVSGWSPDSNKFSLTPIGHVVD